MLEVKLLGQFDVRLGGARINIPTLPARFLLAYLLLNRGYPQSREKLAALFWPDASESSSRNNLRQVLWRIRKALESHLPPESQILLADDLSIAINPGAEIWLDTAILAQPADLVGDLVDAVSVYEGDLLPECYDDWAVVEREYYQAVFAQKMQQLLNLLVEKQRWSEIVPWAERWITLGQSPEPAYRALMYAHAGLGDLSQVAVVYRRCKEALWRELGVEPSEHTTAVHDRLVKGEGSLTRGYVLRELIGKTESGELYRAYQPLLDREVAVKIITPRLANQPDFIRRFESDAQLIARLEHIHIRPLYDYWRDPAGAYLVMRWLNGGNQVDALRSGPMPLSAVIRLLDQITSALETAHRRDVVHGDLKPDNILFDEDGNAFLTDFRIAVDVSVVSSGSGATSVLYAAPEQARGGPATHLSDQYSLALILYEAITGLHPYTGNKKASPDPFSHLQSLGLSSQVVSTFERALAAEPTERFPNMPAMANALRSALAGRQVEIEPGGQQPALALEVQNPFKGLRAFQEADAADFFGRETLIEQILERLDEPDDAGRFLALVGPSGCGKSSVLKAGLLPALRRGALPGSESWFIAEVTPGAHPLDDLAIDLLRIASHEPADLGEQLRRDQYGLLQAAKHLLPDRGSELLLLVDQFEQLFSMAEDKAEVEHFLALLQAAVADPEGSVRVVIALRADYYDRPLTFPAFGALMRRQTEVVIPLNADELRQAIVSPAERAGAGIEPGLPTRIVAEVTEQSSPLPLLQYALTELFEHREGNLLTRQAYAAIGGVTGALARRAEAVYLGLTPQERMAARQIMLRLAGPAEGSGDILRRVPLSELTSMAVRGPIAENELLDGVVEWGLDYLGVPPDYSDRRGKTTLGQDIVGAVLEKLNHSRLLTFDHDPATREPTVEVAHEALLSGWRRLRIWLDDHREDLRTRRLLAAGTQEWLTADRDPSYLALGKRLDQLSYWANETELILTEDERSFLEASLEGRRSRQAEELSRQQREAETRQKLQVEQHQRQRRERVIAGVGVATGLLIILTVLLYFLARQQARVAFSGQLAAACLSKKEAQFDLAALLCVEALHFADTFEARSAMLTLFSENPQLNRYLHGHQSSVTSIAFSQDNRVLATASVDGSVLLWNMATQELMRSLPIGHPGELVGLALGPNDATLILAARDGHIILWQLATGESNHLPVIDSPITSMAISRDHKTLALGSADGRILRWDVGSQQPIGAVLQGHVGAVVALAFSPDRSLLVSSGQKDQVRVWDLGMGASSPLDGRNDQVVALALSPDGNFLASGNASGSISLFNLADRRAHVELAGNAGRVEALVFSPDGKRLASGHPGGRIRLWDISTAQPIDQGMIGHTGAVYAIAYSPDGRLLASGSADRDVILWNVASNQPVHPGAVTGVSFRPDGRQVATGSIDGSVQSWDVDLNQNSRGMCEARGSGVLTIDYSPDGHTAAVANRDGTIHLIDAATCQVRATLTGHREMVTSVAFSPDGKRLASGSADNTIALWDVASGRQLGAPLEGHEDWVLSVAFSPDGQRLASGGRDKKIQLWDVEAGDRLGGPLEGHLDWIYGLAFSPDGRWVASGGADNLVYLWDMKSAPIVGRPLQGHAAYVFAVAFNPNGDLLVSGSADGAIRFWDVETGQGIGQPLAGHRGAVYSLDISSDGEWLASGGHDATFHLWRLNPIAWACAAVGRNLTPAEWEAVSENLSGRFGLLDLSRHQTCIQER